MWMLMLKHEVAGKHSEKRTKSW